MAKNKLSFINKLFFIINNVFATALVIALFIPTLAPEKFGVVSLLSLLTPILIIINFIFIIYWILIGFKKQLILSFLVLLVSFLFIPSIYKFHAKNTVTTKNTLTVMTYNVRKFNKYKWLKVQHIDSLIGAFITKENPDIVTLQEYTTFKNFKLNYPYYSNPLLNLYKNPIENKKYRTNMAIFSKYPIINEGLIWYKNYKTNTMFIDIVKNRDTLRIYNFHLESLGVIPGKEYFGHKDSEKLVKRLGSSFKIQQRQIDTLNAHIKTCNYKIILAGDMNNTAYSWAYRNSKNDFKDSFLEVGKGFGKTYEFKKIPLRIDYIFADTTMQFIQHKNYTKKYSDHYPVSATILLK